MKESGQADESLGFMRGCHGNHVENDQGQAVMAGPFFWLI